MITQEYIAQAFEDGARAGGTHVDDDPAAGQLELSPEDCLRAARFVRRLKSHDVDLIDRCAEAAHEVNRAYCAALGDTSQAPWSEAPDWQRDSARNGVRAVLAGGADHTPERSHEGWLAQKLAEGWTYGPVKDPEAKTHPCCVPYAELPESQRAKDYVFIAVVRAIARELQSTDDGAPLDVCDRAISRAIEDFGMRSHAIAFADPAPGTENAVRANQGELKRRLALVRTKLDEAMLWFQSARRLLESKYPMGGWP